MKAFILKLLLFGIVVFIVDKAFIIIRDNAPKYDFDKRLEMVLEGRVNKDLIVLGSSRGESDIHTKMFEDSLGLSAFNLSWGGSPPEFQELILDKLLAHNNKPKYIVKVLDDDFEIMYKADGTRAFRFDRLYPLVKYPEVRDELIKRGDKSQIMSTLFVLHQLNRSNFDFRPPSKNTLKDTVYGNNPRDRHDESILWTYENSPEYDYSIESAKEIEHFRSIQEKCKNNDIQLILVTAPVFRERSKIWIGRMKDLLSPTTLLYVHNFEDSRYSNERYYGDLSHLNLVGAEILTNEVLQFLKENTDIEAYSKANKLL